MQQDATGVLELPNCGFRGVVSGVVLPESWVKSAWSELSCPNWQLTKSELHLDLVQLLNGSYYIWFRTTLNQTMSC